MISTGTLPRISQAETIPYVSADEAYILMKVQLERLIHLLETLEPGDWIEPTACSLWNVHDMVAHQAGGYASGTGYREMFRQYARIPKKGQLPEDAVNAFQVGERANHSPADLITELRLTGPIAIQKWAYQFRFAKLLTIPHPVPGALPLRHLMWVIHSRDTWMHRLDICRATGRAFEQTADQDGRIVSLVMRDVAHRLQKRLGDRAIAIELTGISGGKWQIGTGQPAALIQMDALDFNVFASGRSTFEQARSLASISGDIKLAESAMQGILILY